MPLPTNFSLSEVLSPFTFDVRIIDINPNLSPTFKKNTGETVTKSVGQTYIDITCEVISGEHAGKQFTETNVHTGIYIGEKGKSRLFVLLERSGVPADQLKVAGISKNVTILSDLIGKVVPGVAKKSSEQYGGKFYLDLRDPETKAQNAAKAESKQHNNDESLIDNSPMIESEFGEVGVSEKDIGELFDK